MTRPWNEIAPDGTAAYCDRWRANYRTMAYAEHQNAYDEILSAHPKQAGWDAEALIERMISIGAVHGPLKVLEFGGWRGGLAHEIFKASDFMGTKGTFEIESWANVEITPLAHEEVECDDPRYSVFVPDRFLWELQMDFGANLFVSSHTIEHITAEHLEKLFRWLSPDIKYMFLQAPLPHSCINNTWEGYGGTHILEVGWIQVTEMLSRMGWDLRWHGGIRDECMFFQRE